MGSWPVLGRDARIDPCPRLSLSQTPAPSGVGLPDSHSGDKYQHVAREGIAFLRN